MASMEYVRRGLSLGQMDLELTFHQMVQLCVAPRGVYRTTMYHRQTKNRWARDDPGFVAVQVYFLASTVVAFCVAYQRSWMALIRGVASSVLGDFFASGILVATVNWVLANRALRLQQEDPHAMEQRVEWLYAFDVHCNAFFPQFLILYVLQYFLLPLLLRRDVFASTFGSNVLYLAAGSVYWYITFLGFEVLPFLRLQSVFLIPVAVIFLLFLVSSGVMFFNPTAYFVGLYLVR